MSPPEVVLSIFDDVGNPHYGGGGAVVVAEISSRLAPDHRVTVYTGGYRGSGRTRTRNGVRYVFLPIGWAGPRGGQLLFGLLVALIALIRRPRVWIESLTPPFSASPLPLLARCPVVGLVQMLSGADMQRRYKLPFTAIERRGLALYRHFVVLNEVDERAVRSASPRASITIIPNGVHWPAVEDAEIGTGGNVLFLGRIDVRQKGLDLLLDAVSGLPLPLVIAGSGTAAEEAKLRALLPTGDSARVRLVGRVDGERKDRLLRECAFMVVPSRYETFCLSALEALAHGKPVVHFDLPRLAWISDCGVAVPAFDTVALGAALRRLAADPTLRAGLGRRARAHSAAYDWDQVAERYRALVTDLLNEPTPHRTG